MNLDLTLDNLISVIRESQNISEKVAITSDKSLETDLGITGDDGCDLLEDIQEQFSLSLVGKDGTTRESFGVEDDQYLFHSEGFDLLSGLFSIFGKKREKVKEITVGQLYEVLIRSSRISTND